MKYQHQRAAEAIAMMQCKDGHAERLRNFIRINYGKVISLASARRIWKQYRKDTSGEVK